MSSIKDLRIVGFDIERPPQVRKESYIDLYFQLSQKAPDDWSEDFNALGRHMSPSPKIDKRTGEFVESYVNDMDLIPEHFERVKQVIAQCTEQYLEKARLKAIALAARQSEMQGQGGAQNRLNEIVANIDFGA